MSANDDENYIFGTSQGKSYVLRYDTQQMKFQQIEQNEDKQLNNWACVIKLNDDEYLLTGGLNSTGKIISNEVVCFNIKNYQFSYFPSFNQCRYVHQGLQKNGCIYILGGRQYGPDFDSVLNHCEKFQNGAWKVIAPMTKRRSNFQVFLLNGQIHAIGGFDGKKNTKSVEWYDEDKNIWRKSKIRLNRGLAGFQLIPKDQNKLLIVGGLTLQGPTQACHLLDLRDNTILAECTLLEQRSLAHMIVDAGNYIIYGGMQKPNIFELYDEGWNQAYIHIQEELKEIFNSGLRGFSSNNKIIQYNLEEYQEEPLDLDPQDYNFLIGNDEFPFIQLIPKFECELPPPIPIPTKLKLFSYMSSCSIDAELPNCRQLFVGAGIDNKISVINKRCYIITIIFPELKIKVKNIGKIQYYRYAASCVYKAPYVYIIGGRGYQNDILSLHSTVERFNIDNEEWEQVSGLNEPKCSLTSCVYNDKIYVIGGYIGEGQITHKIECFDEFTNQWNYLNLELPYALEGLSSIIVDDSLLIIGGKSNDGSSKDIIKFDELEQNQNTSGQIIGQLKYKRSLPKVFLQDDGSLLILGGQFFDSPETTFGEVINGTSQFLQNLQNIMVNMGSDNQLNMFCIA